MRTWFWPACATLLSLVFLVVLRMSVHDGADVTLLSDGAQLAAALLASAGCAVGSRRCGGRQRRAWMWLAAGSACWAAGQAVWSYYEVVLDRPVPFPSLADVGFLAFPLVAGVGLVLWPGKHSHHALTRGRDVMGGAIITVSFLVLSWVAVMAPLVAVSTGSAFSLVLSLAYPIGDVVLATLVVILVYRAESERMFLVLLALGLGGFAMADSLFSYLTSAGTYTSANLVSSSGWVTGFLFVAAAGTTVSRGSVRSGTARPVSNRASWGWLVLPYLPLLGAGVALLVDLTSADTSNLVDLLLGTCLVVLVLGRQFLAMADNQRLMTALGDAGAKLEHIATHDALTGLPNRMLFNERLDGALGAASAQVSVMFCDLDNFKPVNDELGHAGGARLLQIVADRLLACVRTTDTVARIGGDEFAFVLVDCPDPQAVADRVVAAVGQETMVLGRVVQPSMSVGLARQPSTTGPTTQALRREDDVQPSEQSVTAGRLLRMADAAMYVAKSSGKGRVAVHDPDAPAAPVLV